MAQRYKTHKHQVLLPSCRNESLSLLLLLLFRTAKNDRVHLVSFCVPHFRLVMPQWKSNIFTINSYILLLFPILRSKLIKMLDNRLPYFFAWAKFYVMSQTHYYYIDLSPLVKFCASPKTKLWQGQKNFDRKKWVLHKQKRVLLYYVLFSNQNCV